MFTKKLVSLLVIIAFVLSMGMNVFAATVGQPLTSPEPGWQRIDDTNSNILYIGSHWVTWGNEVKDYNE